MRPGFVLLLGSLLAGCMLSTQVGDPHGQVVYHYEGSVNQTIMWGRTAVLGGLAVWLGIGGGRSERKAGLAAAAVVAGLALFLLQRDRSLLRTHRIEIQPSGFSTRLASGRDRQVPWSEIESMYVEGVKFEGVMGVVPKSWRTMTLHLRDGEEVVVDLEWLNMDRRRGAFEAIARKAHLTLIKEK